MISLANAFLDSSIYVFVMDCQSLYMVSFYVNSLTVKREEVLIRHTVGEGPLPRPLLGHFRKHSMFLCDRVYYTATY
jgi:hypothetical protein